LSRVQAILNQSGMTQELRDKLRAECAANTNKLCNVISGNDGLSPCEKFYGKAASYWRILRVFREVGIKVSRLYGLPKKLINKGNHCLSLGYADDRT
jgi:hypothetical protein